MLSVVLLALVAGTQALPAGWWGNQFGHPGFGFQGGYGFQGYGLPAYRRTGLYPGFGPFGGACPPEPSKPANSARCTWEAINDGYGCIIDYECIAVADPPPPPCPPAPAKPETGKFCNWIPIQDKRACIIDYECEPVTPAPCPPAPVKPENGGRCKWTAIKDHKDCLVDWECEPIAAPRFLPAPGGLPYGFGGWPYYKK